MHVTQTKRMRSSTDMMDTRWVNNSHGVLHHISELFDNPELSDVTVVVGYRQYHLHKMLLAQSHVFRVMLLGPQWQDSVQREIRLEEPEECEAVVEDFLRYFYTGKMQLTRHNVIPVLILANKYNVKDLERSCEQCAASFIFSGTPMEQVFDWLHMGRQLNLQVLHKKCMEYMLLNFDLLMRSDCFYNLDLCDLKFFLRSSDLVVSGEYCMYLKVLEWLKHKSRLENYNENLKELAPFMRFCMMATDELVKVEEKLSAFEKGILLPCLFEAFKYHAISYVDRVTDSSCCYDDPRLYTGLEEDTDSPICTTLYLKQSDIGQLSRGVRFGARRLPVSMSRADAHDTCEWFLSFHRNNQDDTINLEVSSTDNTENPRNVEASVLIYKQVNGITFVKGVMQFRCYTRVLASSPNSSRVGHIFSVVVPADAMQLDSPYQIKDGNDSKCMFKLIMRNFPENLPGGAQSEPPEKQTESIERNDTHLEVENIGTKVPAASESFAHTA